MNEDDLMIDTPWGFKRWGMVRKALEMYNKWLNEQEELE